MTTENTDTPLKADCPSANCSACVDAHAVLDADASKIIRNAKNGYPEGREPRELTLAERVQALCVYAADWKRWCEESEKRSDPAMELLKTVHEWFMERAPEHYNGCGLWIDVDMAIRDWQNAD